MVQPAPTTAAYRLCLKQYCRLCSLWVKILKGGILFMFNHWDFNKKKWDSQIHWGLQQCDICYIYSSSLGLLSSNFKKNLPIHRMQVNDKHESDFVQICIYPQNPMPPLVVLVFWSKCLKFAKFLASCTKGQPTSNHVYLLERPSLEQVGRNSNLLQTKAIKSVMDTWPPSNNVRRTPHT